MDKTALVTELKTASRKIEEEGAQIECVYMIPVHTLFKNESYVAVVATPDYKEVGTRSKIEAVSRKLEAHLSEEANRHIQQIWVFDDVEQALRRIAIADVDEFITPIIEPAHA